MNSAETVAIIQLVTALSPAAIQLVNSIIAAVNNHDSAEDKQKALDNISNALESMQKK